MGEGGGVGEIRTIRHNPQISAVVQSNINQVIKNLYFDL